MNSIELYNNPRYYEIAFSYRDIKSEVNVFEECIHRYSKIPVNRVLDIGCGPAPHLEEIVQRGYQYIGLDINETMLEYAREKAETLGITATFIKADMKNFSLEEPVDFTFIMLGSLYATTAEDILSHLDSVARVLKPGGIYFLDWCIILEWDKGLEKIETWTIEKNGIKVDVKFLTEVIDRATQICRSKIIVDVNDNGKLLHILQQHFLPFSVSLLMIMENYYT